MAGSALDSGWFVALPESGGVGRDYRPSFTGSALEFFARIKRDPNDVEAVEHLAEYYEDARDLPSLANLMNDWGKHLAKRGEGRESAAAYVRGADAALMGTGDFARAERMLMRAVSQAPEDEHAVRELHALLATAGKHEQARQWLQFVADALEGRPSSFRARVCYRLGRVLEDHLGDSDAALARYAEALRQDRSYQPARNGLMRLQAPASAGTAPPQASATPEPKFSGDELRARLRSRRSPGVIDSMLTLPAAALVAEEELGAGADAFEVNLGATTDSNFYVGFSSDPRRAGVFIATYQHLPSDRELLLRVTLPGDVELLAAARLRFVRDGLSGDLAPGAGMQLSRMSPDGCDLIARFMQKREPMFYSD